MRSVRLTRNAFINDRYCVSGEIVDIGEHTALAPHMRLLSSARPLPRAHVAPVVAPPDKTVTVHFDQHAGEVDIDIGDTTMRIEHAALKVEVI